MGLDLISSTIVWIFLIGSLTFHFRKNLADLFSRIPLPSFLLFLLVGTAFAIVEENINCPPEGCTFIPLTIPVVLIPFLVLDIVLLKLLRIKDYSLGILSFGIIGWIIEFVWGSSTTLLWSNPFIALIMSLWVIFTYSIIVIVPVTILLGQKTSNKMKR